MELRSFLQRFVLIPAQVVRHARSLIVRLLAWRPELPLSFRFLQASVAITAEPEQEALAYRLFRD